MLFTTSLWSWNDYTRLLRFLLAVVIVFVIFFISLMLFACSVSLPVIPETKQRLGLLRLEWCNWPCCVWCCSEWFVCAVTIYWLFMFGLYLTRKGYLCHRRQLSGTSATGEGAMCRVSLTGEGTEWIIRGEIGRIWDISYGTSWDYLMILLEVFAAVLSIQDLTSSDFIYRLYWDKGV